MHTSIIRTKKGRDVNDYTERKKNGKGYTINIHYIIDEFFRLAMYRNARCPALAEPF